MKLILVFFIFISSNSFAQTDAESLAKKIANKYGYTYFDKIETLTYTFNVKRDTFPASYRSWIWDKKNNIVTLSSAKQNITYKRDTIQSAYVKGIDAKFINDQYWLLFPFHIVMDAGTTLTLIENVIAPITKKRMKKLTIQYNTIDGYTPGDAYDIYVNKKNIVLEWAYRAKGVPSVSLATTWNNNVTNNKITTATDFKNDAGTFNIYFTGVSMQ
jgi:hypothetical protein